jgi:LuxR family maltose regulon positive regulatory protein
MTIPVNLSEARRSRVRAVVTPQAGDADAAPVAAGSRLRPPRGLITRIDRPFVETLCRDGLERQIVVVAGPPGFGKTELLASVYRLMSAARDQHAGWLTLASAHAGETLFLSELGAAFGLPAGQYSGVGAMLDAVAVRPGRTVLFIDEFDAETPPAIRNAMDQLLDGAPDNLRIACACRRSAGLKLARLRVRGLVTEIGVDRLAFTRAEIRRLAGRAADPAAAERILDFTGGWPALVQLVISDQAAGFDAASMLSRTREYIEQVILDELPPPLRAALEACAILDDFPWAMASALSGTPRGLDSIIPDGLAPVLERSGDDAAWFRMHPAIKAHLGARLAAGAETRIPSLHGAASAWFAAHGFLQKAVSHAAWAGDYARAADLITQAGGVHLFLRAGHTVLERLIDTLPSETIHRSAALSLCQTVVLAKQGRIQAARALLDAVRHGRVAASGPLPGVIDHIDGLLTIYEDRHLDDAEIAEMERSAQALDPHHTLERGWLYNHLCIANTRRGTLDQARLNARRALECYRDERSAYGQIFMLLHLGLVNTLAGAFSAALDASREAQDLVQRSQWSDASLNAIVQIPMAEVMYHQGEVASAERLLTAAERPLCRGEGWVELYERLFSLLARSRMKLFGLDAAITTIDRADEVAIERALPRLAVSADIMRIEIFAKAGMLESAEQAAARVAGLLDADCPDNLGTWRERNDLLLARARLRVCQGQYAAAAADLERLSAQADMNGAAYYTLMAAILGARMSWESGQHLAALHCLQSAIGLARPHEIVQPFLDEGSAYTAMLRAIVRRFGIGAISSDAAQFIARIAGRALVRQAGGTDTQAEPFGQAGLFSAREREVLLLLTKGKSNKEIARDLSLAEATVKFHLKNVFGKLGVSRRAMAVSVARGFGFEG